MLLRNRYRLKRCCEYDLQFGCPVQLSTTFAAQPMKKLQNRLPCNSAAGQLLSKLDIGYAFE